MLEANEELHKTRKPENKARLEVSDKKPRTNNGLKEAVSWKRASKVNGNEY